MKRKTDTYIFLFFVFCFFLIINAVYRIVSALSFLILPLTIIAIICIGLVLLYKIYSNLYFNSSNFKIIKEEIQKYIHNCNELNNHIKDLRNSFININSYDCGEGILNDNSDYKFKRKEWQNNIKSHNIHNCSATICKNANNQPIKYLCKYFNIDINEETLSNFEIVLNDFAAAEQGKVLLKEEKDLIVDNISNSISWLIYNFSPNKLINKLGFDTIDFSDVYFPVYTFQYVSAGGNSFAKCDIKLNVENLDKLVYFINDLIKFKKSIQGQRALMTSALREKIKYRDNFSCQKCSLSINDEKNLLLEIDHIIPLSKGGITTEANLQTLCWRCNRSKGSKIENG